MFEVHDLRTQFEPHSTAKVRSCELKDDHGDTIKHEVQATEPLLRVNWCKGHLAQNDEPRDLANSFRGQAVQFDAPEAEKDPAGQKRHDFWPDLSWNRPAGHKVQSDPLMKEPG